MQVFNLINCRKLKSSEVNVFKGLGNNGLFLWIFSIIIILQHILVEFGGQPINCTPLSLSLHIFCLFVGIGALLFAILFRLIPLSIFKLCKASLTKINDESKDSLVL